MNPRPNNIIIWRIITSIENKVHQVLNTLQQNKFGAAK